MITSTTKGQLPFGDIADAAKQAYILPSLTNSSLLSIGQLCNENCIAIFTKRLMLILHKGRVILTGTRNYSDGLWDVIGQDARSTQYKPTTRQSNSINLLTARDKSSHELANFLHACAGSPTIRTFQDAINNNFLATWPGIDKLNMKYLITDHTNIALGHLDQERKNVQSTKVSSDNSRTHNILTKLIPFSAKEMSYGDLTGAFPYTSSRGYKYLYVMYDHDSNGILVEPLKNRNATTIVTAWKALFNRLTKHGHTTKMFVLDNEFSSQLKDTLTKAHLTFQLVPPHVHRRNAAERAIKTFKNHFLSVLATADNEFPITEWDRLLPQAEMTLNLMRAARCNPRLSAYTYLHGIHNFATTPLAPAGTKVVIHKKPQNRASWDYHGRTGWYIGPAPDHYRCFRCFIPSTGREIITDTLRFIPQKITFPHMSIESTIKTSMDKIITLLQQTSVSHPIYSPHKSGIVTAFKQVATLLNNNPRIFSPSNLLSKKIIPSHGPRSWLPEKNGLTPTTKHASPGYNAGEPRVRTTFPPEIRTGTRPSRPRTPNKMADFHRKIPITYPTGIGVIPPPINLPIVPDPMPIKTPTISHDKLFHIRDKVGKKLSLDKLLQDPISNKIWFPSTENELGRLSQGFHNRVKAQDAMDFIHKHEVPTHKVVTYANFVCDYRPLKSEPFRVRMTVGGDKLSYDDDTGSPTASLIEAKLLANSVISDHKKYNSKFCAIDLKDFF